MSARAASTDASESRADLHTFLAALHAESLYPRLNQRGFTLRSLANLSSEDLGELGLPRGPLVRIRAALASGLWEKLLASSSQDPRAPAFQPQSLMPEKLWQEGGEMDGAAFLRASSEPLPG